MLVYSRRKFYEDEIVKKILEKSPALISSWEPYLKDGSELIPHPNPIFVSSCMLDPVTGLTIHKDWTEELQPCSGEVAKC